MDSMEKGWFTEKSELWPDQRFSMKIEDTLHTEKSKYQDILLLQTKSFGKALILDGIIQCTEADEFSYQEMITYLPLNTHSFPEKVLIVGGGDGGVAREVDKHPIVKEFHQVEIDERVIEVSKKYLPFMAKGFTSSKIHLHVLDGLEFLKNHQDEFDVIITDSSDPIGPALCLFSDDYFNLLSKALRPNGIICSQAGNPFSCTKQVRQIFDSAKKSFSNVKYAYTCVPSYPSGQIGFILATNDPNIKFETPKIIFNEQEKDKIMLKYYDENVHAASFVLPRFIRKALYD